MRICDVDIFQLLYIRCPIIVPWLPRYTIAVENVSSHRINFKFVSGVCDAFCQSI